MFREFSDLQSAVTQGLSRTVTKVVLADFLSLYSREFRAKSGVQSRAIFVLGLRLGLAIAKVLQQVICLLGVNMRLENVLSVESTGGIPLVTGRQP